ncbi:MOSC domain-containing protein YiiM [Sinobaca qinghaiensis]|uniref:MOSC domain-containing protein YiiM n=1 Tax=Sinobaca qinghaiensis TaxID=342944 RepID=A0A419V4N9_9BACL|nr:MOSC domain-containing protein YiiM [Sinobaca qinghaiensis]
MVVESSIVSLNVGVPENISLKKDKQIISGINKQSVGWKAVFLSFNGLSGDEQADLKNHGGPDKAVCAYPVEHYKHWKDHHDMNVTEGAFGENLLLRGMPETKVCIGDIYEWGESLIQVSQPRQPCYKLAEKHGIPSLPLFVRENGFSGYYFRVLKEGMVSAEDELIKQTSGPAVSIAEINMLTYQPINDHEPIFALLHSPVLAESWKKTLRKKYGIAETAGDDR